MTYPTCFYDVDYGAVQAARKTWLRHQEKLLQVINAAAPKGRAIIISSREISLTASRASHRQVSHIWPQLACFGQSGSASSLEALGQCKKYVEALVRSRTSNREVPKDVIVPACQTFNEENAATN